MKKYDNKHDQKMDPNIKKPYFSRRYSIFPAMLFTCGLIVGCASSVKDANDFGDTWIALNVYTEKIETIPRFTPYIYQATKLDGSLIGLVTRWAKDSKLKLSLICANDYSLPKQISVISSTSIDMALEELNKIYKDQKVNIAMDSNKAIVFECHQVNQLILQHSFDMKSVLKEVDADKVEK